MIKVPQPSTSITSSGVSAPARAVARISNPIATTLFLLVLSGLIFAAYSNVFFNFFLGDDYGLLVWLKEQMRNPAMILREFSNSWLGSTAMKVYRPMFTVTVLTDYLLYGGNATGFHVTNVLFFAACAICLYFIVDSLAVPQLRSKLPLWPAFAALLFGLYPLHSETVAWVTGRVDAVVTAFSFASIMLYMRARLKRSPWYLAASAAFMVLALLSKEMAIVIPATLFAYELIVVQEKRALWAAAKNTAPFWLLLAGYFVVRRLALGTFIGGYDDSLSMTDWNTFAYNWQQGLRFLLVPANRELMGARHILVVLWQVCLAPCAVLLLFTLRQPALRRRVLFLCIWFAFALAPVYKLFAISDTLQNSRYGYLASAPLCCLLALGLAYAARKRTGLVIATTVMALMLSVAFCMLRINNSAWAFAGTTANAIQSQLRRFYDTTSGDPLVLLLNLPDNLHGAYTCRNAVEGMTQAPQLARDIHNCTMINQFDRIQPFGYLKDSLAQAPVKILVWKQSTLALAPVSLPANRAKSDAAQFYLDGETLGRAVSSNRNTCKITRDASGVATITPLRSNKRAEVAITLPQPTPCYPIDFLAVELQPAEKPIESPVDFEFTNDILDQFDSHDLIRAFLPGAGAQRLIFSLRSHPTWALGGNATKLMLRLPRGSSYRLLALRGMSAERIMPSISLPQSGWLGSKGFAYFKGATDKLPFTYDAAKIPGAAAVELEITRQNAQFEWPNSADEHAKVLLRRSALKGTVDLRRRDFPDLGMFELRLRALDEKGRRIGLASDHFVLGVDR